MGFTPLPAVNAKPASGDDGVKLQEPEIVMLDDGRVAIVIDLNGPKRAPKVKADGTPGVYSMLATMNYPLRRALPNGQTLGVSGWIGVRD